jgi:hypothetical protein
MIHREPMLIRKLNYINPFYYNIHVTLINNFSHFRSYFTACSRMHKVLVQVSTNASAPIGTVILVRIIKEL